MQDKVPFLKKRFINFLNKKGIDNRNLFYSIPTQCSAYRFACFNKNDYANAEYCSNCGTHIGIHQDLTIEQLNYVIESIKEFVDGL